MTVVIAASLVPAGVWLWSWASKAVPPNPRLVAQARRNIEAVLGDPDVVPGCHVRGQPKFGDGGRDRLDFDVTLPTPEEARPSVASASAEYRTGRFVWLDVDLRPVSARPQAANAEAKALDVARRFWKRHYPELWTQTDSLQERTTGNADAWECSLSGVKSGFELYGLTDTRVRLPDLKVVWCLLFPMPGNVPRVKVSEEKASTLALRQLRRKGLTPERVTHTSRWVRQDNQGHARGMWHIEAVGKRREEPYRFTVDVDVKTGHTFGCDGHPLSESMPPEPPRAPAR